MRKSLCLSTLLLLFVHAWTQRLSIIPQPQSHTLNEGYFDLDAKPELQFKESNGKVAQKAISLLKDWNKTNYSESSRSENIIRLGIASKEDLAFKGKGVGLDEFPAEGYILSIHQDEILILGKSDAGMLYGLYSFLQLAQAYSAKGRIPCMEILDYPVFEHRAVMDDISRGPLSNMDFLKKQIRRLSRLKINSFSFYIEHVVKTKKHPAFAPEDGLSPKEFLELSTYAEAYHVKLIGSFQSLGHFRNILRSPDYKDLGASDRMLRPADPEALKFLTEVYGEMIPSFSSEFFNINADEAWDLVRGESKALADSIGAGSLFARHVNPLLAYVQQQNKKPMIWGDMLLSYPDILDKIPRETTILTWDYAARDSFSDWIDPIAEKGFDFWVCPGVLNSNLMMPNWEVTRKNLKNFISEGYRKGARGVMTTVWDDGGGHFFSKDWYGIAYAADQSWKPANSRQEEFDQRFGTVYYQDEEALFAKCLTVLNKLKDLAPSQELLYAFLSKRILSPIGQSHQIASPGFSELGSLLDQAKDLLTKLETKRQENGDMLWFDDLDYWQFFIRHLGAILESNQELIELAEKYRAAQKLKSEGNPEYLQSLRSCHHKVSSLLDHWKALKMDYRRLWLKENRNYWLEEASAVFDDKIEDLISLKSLLSFALQMPQSQGLPDPAAVRLDISQSLHSFFTFWLLADPIPLSAEKEFEKDYLVELGGELKARPTPYDWLKYQSPYMDKIDLKEINTNNAPYIQYVYCQISSPKEEQIFAEVRSDLPFDFILNGKKSHGQKDRILLDLKAGPNQLILKLKIPPNSQQFSMHIPDKEVRNKKQRYRLLE